MEVDDPPADGGPLGTPLAVPENSDPLSGPTTPTPLPRNCLKRRALFSPHKSPTGTLAPARTIAPSMPPAPSTCQQVSAVADDQLLVLSDWKLALTSLAEALDSTVSSLQGRPKELARGLATRFVTLARQDLRQQRHACPPTAPPGLAIQPTPLKQAPRPKQGQQSSSWASVATPEADQGNWQTVAPKQRTRAPQQAAQQPAKQPAYQRPQLKGRTETRIFLRLPSTSTLRAIGPHGIRVTLEGKVPGGITRVQTVATGYAISASEEGKTFLLSPQASELAGDGRFEAATEYYQVIIPRIPRQLWSLDGWVNTTVDDISIEAERTTGIKPLMAKLSKYPVEEGSITAVIAFPRKLQHALQLFGSSGLSRPTRPKQRPLQCTRCHRFHDTRACRSSNCCISCGSSKQEHTCRVQCTNCCGPHAADYQKCPARPHTQRGIITRLSKDALAAVRKAGRLAFQQQRDKKAADKPATSPHTPGQPSSQLAQELASQATSQRRL